MEEARIVVCIGTRDEDPIPDGMFNDSSILHDALQHYIEENKLDPVFVDRNFAIFPDHFVAVFYEDDLEAASEEDINEATDLKKLIDDIK